MQSKTRVILIALAIMGLSDAASFAQQQSYFIKAYGGVSWLSDQSFTVTDPGTSPLPGGLRGNGAFDTGWSSGAAIGRWLTPNWSAEVAWEYRTNEHSTVSFPDGSRFQDGNYASNTIFLNSYYHFNTTLSPRLRPYVGAGVGYVQEIDIDFEVGGVESSFSADGDVGWQLMGGVAYRLTQRLSLFSELKYSSLRDLNLSAESGTGQLSNIGYDPVSLNFGVTYGF